MRTAPTLSRPAPADTSGKSYRTLWRWHFYASLFVMPFLVILAITGTLYCFQPQIEPLLYPHRLVVEPAATPRLSENALLTRARAALPAGARITTASVDLNPRRSAAFVYRSADGDKQSIYLNPYTGEVLGTLSVARRFMQVDRMIHRKLLLGKTGELIMELAACWTLVMIGTGVALWWPHKPTTLGRALRPRLALRGRPLWKSLHAVLGVWLAVGALAFILTGLPWSGSWGKQFKSLATQANLGSPPGAWGGSELESRLPGAMANRRPAKYLADTHTAAHETESMPGMVMDDLPLPQTPWAVGAMTVPQSRAEATPSSLAFAQIVAIAGAHGLTSGYEVAFPASPTGVYTISYFPPDPKQELTLHLDQYSGAVLQEVGYRDYGPVAKAVSYGTALHMGGYFGLANQLLCATISLGLVGMAVSGCVMWWKRRPKRTLGAPARIALTPPMRGWKTGLVLLGVIFPLMGATLLAVWLADHLIFTRATRQAAL